MLTRLRVKGFKSLEDVEVRFGPLTCIAGPNGVGKSNLFDAIQFLKLLSDQPIIDAANSIRDAGGSRSNIAALFTATVNHRAQIMEFEADMVVPGTVTDDFGREAKPKVTYLRYHLALKYVPGSSSNTESLDLVSESLTFIPKGVAPNTLGFDMSKGFFASIYQGSSKNDFLYMDEKEPGVVNLRQDQTNGLPVGIPIGKAWRTVISHINTIDKPTALAARREMQSWGFLKLEASSLREPDDFRAESMVSSTGRHLPAALDRINKSEAVAHRLATLLPDVADVFVDADEKRQLKTLYLKTISGMQYEARALSEGTLRFLALAILAEDNRAGGLLCLEEPENGIHPGRIDAVVELLHQMAVDPSYPVGDDNPLRQLIINTHSPLIVERLKLDQLVVSQPYRRDGASLSSFSGLLGTWRDSDADAPPTSRPVGFGALMAYLVQDDSFDESRPESQNIRQEYLHQVTMMDGGEK